MVAVLPRNSRVFEPGASNPATDFFAITPHDSNNEAAAFRAVYVGVAGDVAIVSANGNVATFKNAQAGSVIPVEGVRVNTTNTTATDLIGLA